MRCLIIVFLVQLFYANIPGIVCQGITVQTNCPGTTNSYGYITSPNYPSNYGNYESCYWLLTVHTGTATIHLSFDSFHIESGWDYVRVYDGSLSNLIGTFSGNVVPSNLISASNQINITFTSDSSVTERGFSLNYAPSLAPRIKVTCEDSYMVVDLGRSHFSNITWENLHLNDPACRASLTSTTIRLRTRLNSCGTTHKEYDDKLVFTNKVIDDKSHLNDSDGVITRESVALLQYHCKYSRRKTVGISFNASKETMQASEENFGNFTFSMHMYRSANYRDKYSPNEFPVSVDLGQQLWIQVKVTDAIGDLVVFAETCRATLSTDPNSSPNYVFLKHGCPMDSTMIYRYYPSSSVQRFSIKSFRFLRTSKRLVYLHCELLVCHRNSTNSRCSSGCVGSRRRRDTDDYDDTSNSYGLSTGPIAGDKIDLSETDQNKGTEHKVQGMTIGLSVMGGVLALVCAAVIMKLVHAKVLKSRKSRSASAYEVKTNEGSAASNLDDCPTEHAVNAYDGPAAFQLDEIAKA